MKILSAGPDADLVLGNTGQGRQPGVHLSDILKRMAYEKDQKYHPDKPMDMMALECGFTWEEVLSQSLAARHKDRAGYRPEQIQEDGVWMSPDWVNPGGDVQMEEWKATRKSVKSYEEKVQEWGPQMKSYLRALLKRGVARRPVVRLRVWFIMGDWSFEAKGDMTLLRDYWRIDVEFDKRDLEENWWRVVNAGRRYGLLKTAPKEEQWAEPQQPKQHQPRSSRSSGRVISRGKPVTGTRPHTKTSSKPPAESS